MVSPLLPPSCAHRYLHPSKHAFGIPPLAHAPSHSASARLGFRVFSVGLIRRAVSAGRHFAIHLHVRLPAELEAIPFPARLPELLPPKLLEGVASRGAAESLRVRRVRLPRVPPALS